jgi:hypothetical protein
MFSHFGPRWLLLWILYLIVKVMCWQTRLFLTEIGAPALVGNLAPIVVTAFLETQLERVDHPLSPEEPLESEQLERYLVSCSS